MSEYFTVKASAAGFTDQLLELDCFGRLGHALGMTYLFTPLVETRTQRTVESLAARLLGAVRRCLPRLSKNSHSGSQVDENIHDLLGVNDALRNASAGVSPRKCLDFVLSDDDIRRASVATFSDLVTFVSSRIPEHHGGVLRFSLRGGKKFFRVLRSADVPQFVDFGSCISAAKSRWGDSAWDATGGMLLHFRAGDLAVLECASGCLAVRKHAPNRLQWHSTVRAADEQWVSACEFTDAIHRLGLLRSGGGRAVMCSDGFERAVNEIPEASMKVTVDPSALNDDLCRTFAAVAPGVRCSIGERADSLLALVNALMTCDTVVTKDCGLLVLKFLSLFRRQSLPMSYVLHHGAPPDYNLVDVAEFGDRVRFERCDQESSGVNAVS